MKILYVDDDPDDRQVFQEALKSIDENCICATAKDGLDALTYLGSNALPDLIFLDINMPLMNGKTCLAEIKGNKITAHLPVIIFTTSHNPVEKDEFKRLGASDFVLKPVSYLGMKNILTAIFNSRKNMLMA
jgi:CheY-like chemotaxis protein